jgi:conjugative transposon TraN protein
MKKISAVFFVSLLALLTRLFAQGSTSPMEPIRVQLAYNKTTNIIFPFAIKSVDKGSKDVLVQKAKGVENVLQVKAGKTDFDPTNLTVITSDAHLYSFILSYNPQPFLININVTASDSNPESNVIFSAKKDDDGEINSAAAQISLKKPFLKRIRDKKYDIGMWLTGIYIKNDVLYFQLTLENNSNINYDIDQLRFYIKDQNKSRRTASQEIELNPLSTAGNDQLIRDQSRQVLVVAIPKMTIPDKKHLSIQLMEKNGGRQLHLTVGNKAIVKAKQVI